jgi:hypothetical protein
MVKEVLLGSHLARNRSSPQPGAGMPAGCTVGRGGGGLRVGVQGSGAYIAKGEPPSDQWMDGSALGTHMAGQRGTNRWSLACSYGESVLEAFPAFEASGGEP